MTMSFSTTHLSMSSLTSSAAVVASDDAGKKRLAAAMAFLAGCANLTIFSKFKTFATMLTGNTMWMAVALTHCQFVDVAYYLSVVASYLLGTALFRRADVIASQQQQQQDEQTSCLPRCAAVVAALFVLGDVIHYNPWGRQWLPSPLVLKWIPMMLFATAFGICNALGQAATGTLNFVVTGHYSKLTNLVVDRYYSSRTLAAGRRQPLSAADKNAALHNAGILGGFMGGVVFAAMLMQMERLHQFGVLSVIGFMHAALWMVHAKAAWTVRVAWPWPWRLQKRSGTNDDEESLPLPHPEDNMKVDGPSAATLNGGNCTSSVTPMTEL